MTWSTSRRRTEAVSWPGVRLHGGSPLHRAGLYSRDVVMGIAENGENMEAALQLLKEILAQTAP